MTARLIITSDLHQSIGKWRDLVRRVEQEKPRFVLIAGDLLPKDGGFNGQRKFFPVLANDLGAMRGGGKTTILTFFGNDDFHPLEPLLDDLAAKGLCVNLNGRVHREEGWVFCGMNRVRDYPFGYKHWCAPDGDFVACPQQFCGEGLEMNEKGAFVPLDNLAAYLSAKPSIGDELNRLKAQLRPGEMEESIWMIHQPPTGLGMDICGDGRQVGSPTVLKFIQDNQPLLGCSGHIHESPYQPAGQWMTGVGRTVWAQPGQMATRLHHVSLEISEALSVSSIRHSIFG